MLSAVAFMIMAVRTGTECDIHMRSISLVDSTSVYTFISATYKFFLLQVLGADVAILDEIDSGLDVDALQDVAQAVNMLLTPKKSVIMITHYQRLLDYIKPKYVHIMVSGFRIIHCFHGFTTL